MMGHRYRIPPLGLWPRLAALLIRLGILQVRSRWGCLVLGTTMTEVRRRERLRSLVGGIEELAGRDGELPSNRAARTNLPPRLTGEAVAFSFRCRRPPGSP